VIGRDRSLHAIDKYADFKTGWQRFLSGPEWQKPCSRGNTVFAIQNAWHNTLRLHFFRNSAPVRET
jgi:hypothetical protein